MLVTCTTLKKKPRSTKQNDHFTLIHLMRGLLGMEGRFLHLFARYPIKAAFIDTTFLFIVVFPKKPQNLRTRYTACHKKRMIAHRMEREPSWTN